MKKICGKRNLGGIVVFIENDYSEHVEVAHHKNEYIMWLKMKDCLLKSTRKVRYHIAIDLTTIQNPK